MQAYLLGHLLSLVLLDEKRFRNDFSGHDFAGREVLQLVTFGKAALKNLFEFDKKYYLR